MSHSLIFHTKTLKFVFSNFFMTIPIFSIKKISVSIKAASNTCLWVSHSIQTVNTLKTQSLNKNLSKNLVCYLFSNLLSMRSQIKNLGITYDFLNKCLNNQTEVMDKKQYTTYSYQFLNYMSLIHYIQQ